MKAFALAIIALAVPAAAQTPTAAPAAAPAAAASSAFSVDTSIEALAADPRSKAVLDKELPQLLSHPAYEQFKTMTLAQLAPMSEPLVQAVAF